MNKHIYLIPVFFIMLLLTACSNDDDTAPANELEGTWELISFEVDAETFYENDVDGVYYNSHTYYYDTKVVKDDYTLTFDGDQFTVEGNYELRKIRNLDDEDPICDVDSHNNILQTNNYSIDGSTIIIEGTLLETDDGTSVIYSGDQPQTMSYAMKGRKKMVLSQNETFVVIKGNYPDNYNRTTNMVVASSVWKKK